ncbi:hypothetical protein ACWD01_22285 [Streptomyces sp. NPDC002835]
MVVAFLGPSAYISPDHYASPADAAG